MYQKLPKIKNIANIVGRPKTNNKKLSRIRKFVLKRRALIRKFAKILRMLKRMRRVPGSFNKRFKRLRKVYGQIIRLNRRFRKLGGKWKRKDRGMTKRERKILRLLPKKSQRKSCQTLKKTSKEQTIAPKV